MAQLSARRIALAALCRWRREKRFADSVISEFLANAELTQSDRAFALELFYGVLRNLTLLDFWISCLRASRVEVDLREVLRLGLYQLFFLKTAPHATVYETVELAPKRQRAVTNGVLRNAARRRDELLARGGAQPLFVRTSHPQFLIDRWERHFGAKAAEELCRWNNLPSPVYGRVNQLKIDRGKFLQQYPESRPLVRNAEFVELDGLPENALNYGHCYVQDPSTVIACQLLDPKPTEKILDSCAAPGDRVLVDAPCSNTGVMRRRVDVRWRLRPGDLTRMPDEQFEITRSAISLLKPGGVLVYSTCSLEPEENEQLVERLLNKFPQLRLANEKFCLPFRDHFDGAFAARLINTYQVQNHKASRFVERPCGRNDE